MIHKSPNKSFFFSLVYAVLLLTGCTSLLITQNALSDAKMEQRGFIRKNLKGPLFSLCSYVRFGDGASPVHVYIEGDGKAFLSRTRISPNPTPTSSLVRDLACLDPAMNVIYLARPCQYTAKKDNPGWDRNYWTTKRFAPEVVSEMNNALSFLKEDYGFSELHLFGYSGGAAIAVLIAAERKDVIKLITIAGNLDHDAVNRFNKVPLLSGSLNPVDHASMISHIPQFHFIGENDEIIPHAAIDHFSVASDPTAEIQVISVPGCTHHKGWQSQWPTLLVSAGYLS